MELLKKVEDLTVYGDENELFEWINEEVILNYLYLGPVELTDSQHDEVRDCLKFEYEAYDGDTIYIYAGSLDGQEWNLSAYRYTYE